MHTVSNAHPRSASSQHHDLQSAALAMLEITLTIRVPARPNCVASFVSVGIQTGHLTRNAYEMICSRDKSAASKLTSSVGLYQFQLLTSLLAKSQAFQKVPRWSACWIGKGTCPAVAPVGLPSSRQSEREGSFSTATAQARNHMKACLAGHLLVNSADIFINNYLQVPCQPVHVLGPSSLGFLERKRGDTGQQTHHPHCV